MRGIKVDISEHGSTRRFWVLREEGKGNAEDFSIQECPEAIERSLPAFADYAGPAVPAVAKAASSNLASPKKEGTEEKTAESPSKQEEDTKEERKEEKKDAAKKEEKKEGEKKEEKKEGEMKD